MARITVLDRNSWNGDMIFETKGDGQDNGNTAERLRLTHQGRLGIGIKTPQEDIHLSTTDHPYFRITATDNTDAGMQFQTKGISGEPGGTNQYALFIQGTTGDFNINEDYVNGAWSPTVRFKIKNNTGWVGIGINDPGAPLHVAGDVKATGYQTGSDRRLKKNIRELGPVLARLMRIRGVSFDWRTDEFPKRGFSRKRQIGLLAQEVQQQFPELVHTDNRGFLALSYHSFNAILLEAVKEQQTKLHQQSAQLHTLEQRLKQQGRLLDKLTVRLRKLEARRGR